ncbi:MAG: isoleucine--tRNA ligase [Halobacteriaceae archaeon]
MDDPGDVAERYDPGAVEDRVREYWDAVDAYERTREHRADGEPYYFLDGPPYTSGSAHMGHAWNKSLKDVYVRYLSMCGYDVYDRPGYDMHGLPIETKVEERLGFENKKDILEFGEDAFIEECKAYAEEQLEGLQDDFRSFGVWMDWEDPYRTVDPSYMEAAWWAFQRAHDRGLVEQGKRSISQCPRCETAIANNEVEYEDVEDPSIYVRFPLAEREGSLVVWTTTPWTLPANTFVAVAADLTYQAVEAVPAGPDGEPDETAEPDVLWVAAECVEGMLSAGRYADYEVVDEVAGSEMVGWGYEHPLADAVPDHPSGDGSLEVYTADYVEADRTGLVHSAPGHGEEDFERGRELGLELFCPVGPDGVFEAEAGAFAGAFVKDADEQIVETLDAAGLLLASETVTHSYGHCWRCDTGIVQIVTDQWFITITDVKEELLANVEDSEWYPEWARDSRFRDFVEDAPDWNVSRQRYWGIAIPIWTPEDWSGDMADAIVVGDRAELAERVDQDVDPDDVDLHKDTVDDLTITEDGRTYTRVPDVFDVWLDSSVAPWGAVNYPEETDAFEELYPADLIVEAHDQTRGWFWSQLGMGTAALGEVPYERVLMHGHALMPDGRAMSKSRDIRVDPGEVLDEHGADPMRLFLLSVAARGEDMQFSWEETAEMRRRLNILWNVYRFPLPYMAMDDFDPAATTVEDVRDDLAVEDRWVLSRLQTTVDEMTEAMDDFRQDEAVDALLAFVVDDVSRYYVQVVRERMWEEADTASKTAAYATVYRVLETTVALLAPFAPFVAEEIHRGLTGDRGHPTVHMADWPAVDGDLRDPGLEERIAVVRDVEEAGSNARQQAGRKLRWPVPEVIVDAGDESVVAAVERHRDLLADRLNARAVTVIEPGESWGDLAYGARADMSVLGPAFGEDAGAVMEAINAVTVDEPSLPALREAVAAELGREVELTDEMVTFERETPADVAGAEFAGGAVFVDASLTDDIESEGYAREVIRRVQEMRKEMDLEVDRPIRLDVMVFDEDVAELLARREDLIAEETRAAELGEVADGHVEEWEVEGVDVRIAVETLPQAAAE